MKSLLTVLALFVFAAGLFGQDKPPEQPSNLDVDQFDSFKTNSFGIMNESIKADQDITLLDKEVKNYAGALASANIEKLRTDYKAAVELAKLQKSLTERIGTLDEQGKAVLQSAKDFTPKMKSPAAVKNVNKSIQALDFARKKLTTSGVLLKDDAAILVKELKARGETVPDFIE